MHRSNSINVTLPEFNNPNSLAKLARSSLLHLSRNPLSLAKLAWSQLKTKPSNLVLSQLNVNTNTTAGSSFSQTETISNTSGNYSIQKLVDTPLPSPGPLLGKTPLVDSYNNTSSMERKSEEVIIMKMHDEGSRSFNKEYSPKRQRFNNYPSSHIPQQQQPQQQPQQQLQQISAPTVIHHEMNLSQGTNSNHLLTGSYAINIQQHQSASELSSMTKQPQSYAMCGGEVQMLDRKEDRMRRYLSSGGCVIPISECPEIEVSPKMIRTPLLSGGSFTEISTTVIPKNEPAPPPPAVTPSSTPKMMIPIAPLTPSLPAPNLLSASLPLAQHFQFPPINSITAFNPLTLPPVTLSSMMPSSVLHGDKLIPFVPGIPGPNTLAPPAIPLVTSQRVSAETNNSNNISRILSPKKTPSPALQQGSVIPNSDIVLQQQQHSQHIVQTPNSRYQQQYQLQKPIIRIEHETSPPPPLSSTHIPSSDFPRVSQKSPRNWSQTSVQIDNSAGNKKTFNFTRMADNLSPKKPVSEKYLKSPERDSVRNFSFEVIGQKSEIITTLNIQPPQQQQQQSQAPTQQQKLMPLHVDVNHIGSGGGNVTSTEQKELQPSETEAEVRSKAKSKFLRPTSLPLKPGTFTPKVHHGITPTANTLPLISPETPRPSKACVQLYLNGHAYTYLGLKCSTKMFYCTVNCPQPSYKANLHKLSMYSVWQVCAEYNPHPLGLKPKSVMSLYDSHQRSSAYSMARINCPYTTLHSQETVMTVSESSSTVSNSGQYQYHSQQIKSSILQQQQQMSVEILVENGKTVGSEITAASSSGQQRITTSNVLVGGYESNEDYTYIRGRGRGRYVCSECGIRCKKPSMLKKHIRTHTDVRPYTCTHCSFRYQIFMSI